MDEKRLEEMEKWSRVVYTTEPEPTVREWQRMVRELLAELRRYWERDARNEAARKDQEHEPIRVMMGDKVGFGCVMVPMAEKEPTDG